MLQIMREYVNDEWKINSEKILGHFVQFLTKNTWKYLASCHKIIWSEYYYYKYCKEQKLMPCGHFIANELLSIIWSSARLRLQIWFQKWNHLSKYQRSSLYDLKVQWSHLPYVNEMRHKNSYNYFQSLIWWLNLPINRYPEPFYCFRFKDYRLLKDSLAHRFFP